MKRKRGNWGTVCGFAAALLGCGLFWWVSYVRYRKATLEQPLIVAIRSGTPGSVARLIARGADPNSRDRPAPPRGLLAMLKRMLHSHPVDRDENFETALMVAGDMANLDAARLLIDHGADVRATGPDRYTALHRAAASRSDQFAELLLRHGADPNQRAKGGDTPLIVCIRDGGNFCLETLLRNGAKATLANTEGITPIRLAAEAGQPKLYTPLLQRGADPNTRDKDGKPLLTRAVESGREDLLDLLLRYHADPNIPGTKVERTVDGRMEHIENPLITALTPAEPYEYYYTRVQVSAATRLKIVRRLLEARADPNTKDAEGRPALWKPISLGFPKEAELLLNAGANPDGAYEGSTLLMLAAYLRNLPMVKLLLRHRATPDLRGENGTTALMIAAYDGDDGIVGALLASGAHPRVADSEGLTAFQHAVGSPQTLALLHSAAPPR